MRSYLDPAGHSRGLQQVSYDDNQYRATIKRDGETILVSTRIGTMREAIADSNGLGIYYAGASN